MYTDPLDHAAHLQQVHNDESLKQAMKRAAPEQVKKKNGKWETEECIDCGEPIGTVRLTLGKVRCILCQEALEKRRAGGFK